MADHHNYNCGTTVVLLGALRSVRLEVFLSDYKNHDYRGDSYKGVIAQCLVRRRLRDFSWQLRQGSSHRLRGRPVRMILHLSLLQEETALSTSSIDLVAYPSTAYNPLEALPRKKGMNFWCRRRTSIRAQEPAFVRSDYRSRMTAGSSSPVTQAGSCLFLRPHE